MARLIQPSFAKGEVSPALYGRVDTQAYQVALRTARNTIIHPYGGVSSRNGMKYLEPVKTHTDVARLIPFSFKTDDQYILELGDQYMRFMRNDAHVLDTSEQEAITGATAADPVVITTGTHGYSNGQEVFISGVVGMTELNNKRFTIANVTGTTFELTSQVDGTDIDGSAFTAYTSGGTADLIFEITTPYAKADLFDITYVQSADTMTLCHKDYAPRELTRTDHDAWTLTAIAFLPTLADPNGIVVSVGTPASQDDRYTVTAINTTTGEESLAGLNNTQQTVTNITQATSAIVDVTSHGFIAGDEVEFDSVVGMTEINGLRAIVTTPINTNDFAILLDTSGFTAYSSAGTATTTFVKIAGGNATRDNTITWSLVTDANKYAVYRRKGGIYGLIGETTNLTFFDDNFDPDTSVSFPESRNPFASDNDPGAVSFYEQRRVFGGSTDNPDTSYFSQTGRISNFNVHSPTQADDAITARLTSREVNEIRQYVPLNDLIILTSGGEWLVNAGPDSVLAPDTIQQKPQTEWGSSYRQPITIGSTIMYVTSESAGVRSLGYSLQADSYTGSDMLLFADHLLENDTVKDWAYTREPESRVYATLVGGDALTMTFDQEQEVLAWTTWDTDGDFESCAALRGNGDDNEDSIYFTVERTINGNTVRYIEVWRQEFFDQVQDCFFVDSGLSLDSPVTVSGSTAADPVVVTATAHGFSDGDFVDFEEIEWEPDVDSLFNSTQPDQLNGRTFKVANKTANTFELTDFDDVDIDGSSYNAYIRNGVVRKNVTTVSGLDHLEGESVVILSDGDVVTGKTVSSGAVTLDSRASRIHFGLRYIADVETLDPEVASGQTVQGQHKKISKAIIRFKRSRGLLIGPDSTDLDEWKQREFENMDAPTELLTGDLEKLIPPHWNTNGRLFLRQKDPLPMTILAIIPIIEGGDDTD